MIHWTMALTGNQIAVLRALRDREFGKDWDSGHGISHWISGIRPLIREGLIEHREVNLENGYVDSTRTGQFITEKGRIILDLVEHDLAHFIEQARKPVAKQKGKAAA